MRLIDADYLLLMARYNVDEDERKKHLEYIENLVSRAPTACDADKVVEPLKGADMQEVFEKIIEKLEEECFLTTNDEGETNELSVKVVDLKDAIEIVKQAAAEYSNGWIPCSERLPEDIGWYLVSRNDGIVTTGYFFEDMTWREARGVEYIAWQPLPEPYMKGEV